MKRWMQALFALSHAFCASPASPGAPTRGSSPAAKAKADKPWARHGNQSRRRLVASAVISARRSAPNPRRISRRPSCPPLNAPLDRRAPRYAPRIGRMSKGSLFHVKQRSLRSDAAGAGRHTRSSYCQPAHWREVGSRSAAHDRKLKEARRKGRQGSREPLRMGSGASQRPHLFRVRHLSATGPAGS